MKLILSAFTLGHELLQSFYYSCPALGYVFNEVSMIDSTSVIGIRIHSHRECRGGRNWFRIWCWGHGMGFVYGIVEAVWIMLYPTYYIFFRFQLRCCFFWEAFYDSTHSQPVWESPNMAARIPWSHSSVCLYWSLSSLCRHLVWCF